jgi:hypothetical protein
VIDPKLSMRTDDVAHRIEYATGVVWTPAQYRQVCSILRDYRHHSIMVILERAAEDPESNNEPGVRNG